MGRYSMKARCIKSVPAFLFVEGNTYDLTEGQYNKLQEKYHCFALRESLASQVIMVRVLGEKVIPDLKFVDGRQWFPGSEHMAMRKDVQAYVDSGKLEMIDLHAKKKEDPDDVPVHATPVPGKHEINYEWLTSHPDYNNKPLSYVTAAIRLAFQCGIEEANNWLVEKRNEGLIFNYDGKISW